MGMFSDWLGVFVYGLMMVMIGIAGMIVFPIYWIVIKLKRRFK